MIDHHAHCIKYTDVPGLLSIWVQAGLVQGYLHGKAGVRTYVVKFKGRWIV